MSVVPGEKGSLEDFRRWKVLQLKEFLQNRGLKTSGTKGELASLAFGARPSPILLVKCWKVVHWNAKKLLPKFQKLPPEFLFI